MTTPNARLTLEDRVTQIVDRIRYDGDPMRIKRECDSVQLKHEIRSLLARIDAVTQGQDTDRLGILARCYGQRSALGQEGADQRLCDQRDCARCWRRRCEVVTRERHEARTDTQILDAIEEHGSLPALWRRNDGSWTWGGPYLDDPTPDVRSLLRSALGIPVPMPEPGGER